MSRCGRERLCARKSLRNQARPPLCDGDREAMISKHSPVLQRGGESRQRIIAQLETAPAPHPNGLLGIAVHRFDAEAGAARSASRCASRERRSSEGKKRPCVARVRSDPRDRRLRRAKTARGGSDSRGARPASKTRRARRFAHARVVPAGREVPAGEQLDERLFAADHHRVAHGEHVEAYEVPVPATSRDARIRVAPDVPVLSSRANADRRLGARRREPSPRETPLATNDASARRSAARMPRRRFVASLGHCG